VTEGPPTFHSISVEDVRALVDGGGPGRFVPELVKAERSRRMLLLRAFLDMVCHGAAAQEAPVVLRSWVMLERAQRVAPEAVDEILMSPGTGVWVSSALRRLRGDESGQVPLWAVTGRLSALAAAAAIRAGLSFSIDVPLHGGTVSLPGLGCARFEDWGGRVWAKGRAVGREGALCVSVAGREVRTGPDWRRPVPGWLPTRRLALGPSDAALRVVLEEHDPYRAFSPPVAPRLLERREERLWYSSLADAWDILRRDDPVVAEEISSGPLLSIAPVAAREEFRPYSSSASEAFGGVSASLPDSPSQIAATLVHEFQHIKLGALINLEPLLRRAENKSDRSELFYAPWRDDPRPLEGLIQGIYAFFGVSRFWRSNRQEGDKLSSALANFEFALSRQQVETALKVAGRHHRLTPVGRRLLCSLAERCDVWMTEKVSHTGMRLAVEAATDHRARWRAYHLRPSSQAVEEAVRAWRRGDTRPPDLLAAPPRPVPDARADCLDTAATLARHILTDPQGEWGGRTGYRVTGAGRADVLLALGERSAARRVLMEQLSCAENPSPASWPLLGRALADDAGQKDASRLLLRYPERVKAVHEALRAAGAKDSDPLRLVAWLSGGA
jgi:HEXXH motif-containing protein